jgi:hypothetical protein
MEQKKTCKECKEYLIKQYLDVNWKPAVYNTSMPTIVEFGKRIGTHFNELTKKQVRAYLEQHWGGHFTWIRTKKCIAIFTILHE